MGEDGQRVPVGPSALEDGGFDGVVPSGPVQVDIGRGDWRLRGRVGGGGCERQQLAVLQLRRLEARLPRSLSDRGAKGGKAKVKGTGLDKGAGKGGKGGKAKGKGTRALATLCGNVGQSLGVPVPQRQCRPGEEQRGRDAGKERCLTLEPSGSWSTWRMST